MFESAKTLQAICFDFICTNFYEMCEVYDVHELVMGPPCLEPSCSRTFDDLSVPDRVRFKCYKTKNVMLPSKISEPLLASISEKESFSDLYLAFFGSQTTKLKHVILKNASRLSLIGFRTLKQHDIVDLEITHLFITINDLITCLNDWSLQNLRSLSLPRQYKGISSYSALSNLPALQALNVSFTKFNSEDLAIVVENLPKLESIDISHTLVDDITILIKCKDRLKTLKMRWLHKNTYDHAQMVFLEMDELRTLDISVGFINEYNVLKTISFLKEVDTMPHLTSLDMSDIHGIDESHLSKFIQAHPQLSYLGLVWTNADTMEILVNPSHPDFRPDLKVGGLANESQIIETLKRYSNHGFYLTLCLYHMAELLDNLKTKRADLLRLIIPIMQLHPEIQSIQIKGGDCLYNLTYLDRALQIHPSILHQAVDVMLTTLEKFPTCLTIYRNAVKMISNHQIFYNVNIDKMRCVRLMSQSLLEFNVETLDEMCLKIIWRSLTKMSYLEASELGTSNHIIQKLLSILQLKARDGCKYYVEVATRSLRYLTNCSIVGCRNFIGEGGLEICFDILKRFREQPIFNVNGLFYIIAEFGELRQRLMVPEFMKILPVLMESPDIIMSYYAAGVAAHLLSDGPQIWTDDPSMPTKTQILDKLLKTVNDWKEPYIVMYICHSFEPVLPLLRATEPYPVQLWAAWSIHHVCVKDPKRYCGILTSENGDEILKSLEKDSSNGIQPGVRALCRSILDILALHQS